MDTEYRFTLETGPDSILHRVRRVLPMLAIMGFVLSPAVLLFKATGILMCLALYAFNPLIFQSSPNGRLVLFFDGQVRWRDAFNQDRTAKLQSHHWLMSRYAVIRVGEGQNTAAFLISRSLQSPGDFQRVSSWLRLESSCREPHRL